MRKLVSLIIINSSLITINYCSAQPLNQKKQFTHQDTLRGTIGPERSWWNVLHYDVAVTPDYDTKTIKGKTIIQYKIVADKHSDYLQIDLQQPLTVDTFFYDGKMYINYPAKPYYNEGNVWHVPLPPAPKNSTHTIAIAYHGKPREAKNPPWDGGWIFTKDAKGRPWMTVACQGLGASAWYPCKDHQSDEPDNGATLNITVADSLVAVGNGRLKEKRSGNNGTTTWTWEVKSPINNYNIIPYIGKYVTWHEDYPGEKGKLDCDYWVLDYDLEKAQKQFTQARDMLKCFEFWMGPYPFYEDGYKLVETPHLGMEHQSAVAYGNKFMNGYLGRDLSGSGWGKNWDYIIVHESGHEWFANNITTNDIADMWVHEGITDYSETLFVDCMYGNEAGDAYTQGLRRSIRNDIPIIGIYGVNQEGSGDMYNKGNNMMHTIRQIINDDSLFRKVLRGMTETFYHKTVDSKDIENYISQKSGKDLSKVFDQYLRTIKIPALEYQFVQKTNNADAYEFKFRWANCVDGFNMPVRINFAGKFVWINPGTDFKTMTVSAEDRNSMPSDLAVDKNFYITVKKL
jgi:aminopeptidase N